jgi:hypothetical protein
MIDSRKRCNKTGSTSIQQSTLLRLSTNSIQNYNQTQPDGTSILLQLQCDQCNMIGTVPHLTNCTSTIGIKYRNELHHSIKTLLKTNSSVIGWTQKHDYASLYWYYFFPYQYSPLHLLRLIVTYHFVWCLYSITR